MNKFYVILLISSSEAKLKLFNCSIWVYRLKSPKFITFEIAEKILAAPILKTTKLLI